VTAGCVTPTTRCFSSLHPGDLRLQSLTMAGSCTDNFNVVNTQLRSAKCVVFRSCPKRPPEGCIGHSSWRLRAGTIREVLNAIWHAMTSILSRITKPEPCPNGFLRDKPDEWPHSKNAVFPSHCGQRRPMETRDP
jgi:hypothetical protein